MGLVTYTTPAALTTFGFTAFGLASLVSAYKPYPTDPTEPMYCDAPGSTFRQVHPREVKLEQLVSPSFYEKWFGTPENPKDYLNFDDKSLRNRFLFLSAD